MAQLSTVAIMLGAGPGGEKWGVAGYLAEVGKNPNYHDGLAAGDQCQCVVPSIAALSSGGRQ